MAGMKETLLKAEAGLALFEKEVELDLDVEGATAFKQQHEVAIKEKEDLAASLTGKDNKKARTEVSKEVAAMKADEKYVDACKVVKGLAPPKGNFCKTEIAAPKKKEAAAAVVPEAPEASKAPEKEKKSKKTESAGLSKAERDELEKLKKDIIERKAELKGQGMSGGQCNKDEQVVAWVARMTELKIKEDPSLADAGKKEEKKAPKKASSEEKVKLEKQIEEYRLQLKSEFGYSDKDIKADPDMQDMLKALSKMK